MASLSKAQINTIANAVKKRLPRVKLNKDWQFIHRQFNLGEPDGIGDGKYLYFTGSDYDGLREMVRLDSGLDMLTLNFELDRQQFAKQSHKEKFANIRPEANYVLVKLPQGCLDEGIPFLGLSQELALRLPVEQVLGLCHKLAIKQLVVVENLDSFDCIYQQRFDESLIDSLTQTLFVYRGSGAHSPAGCKRLLQQLSQDSVLAQAVTVVAYTDLDPAGLQIAYLLKGCSAILVPKLALESPAQLQADTLIIDPHDFTKQFKQQAFLDKVPLGAWQPLVSWMKHHRVSIKQQSFLAHGFSVGLLKR